MTNRGANWAENWAEKVEPLTVFNTVRGFYRRCRVVDRMGLEPTTSSMPWRLKAILQSVYRRAAIPVDSLKWPIIPSNWAENWAEQIRPNYGPVEVYESLRNLP